MRESPIARRARSLLQRPRKTVRPRFKSSEANDDSHVIAIEHVFAVIEPWIGAYGALALFAIIYLESFGMPVPGESALVSVSVLAARGDLSISHVVLAAWSGAVLGDSTGYLIGHLGGRRLLLRVGPKIGLTHERYTQLSDEMSRHGFVVVVLARFFVVLRQANGLLAGSLAMPLARFVPANIIGAGLWVTVWALGPYFFGNWFALPAVSKMLPGSTH